MQIRAKTETGIWVFEEGEVRRTSVRRLNGKGEGNQSLWDILQGGDIRASETSSRVGIRPLRHPPGWGHQTSETSSSVETSGPLRHPSGWGHQTSETCSSVETSGPLRHAPGWGHQTAETSSSVETSEPLGHPPGWRHQGLWDILQGGGIRASETCSRVGASDLWDILQCGDIRASESSSKCPPQLLWTTLPPTSPRHQKPSLRTTSSLEKWGHERKALVSRFRWI